MWTKSQKISAAVLALAAGAFGVDRWVLERPAEAAEVADVAAPVTPASSRATATAATPKPAAAAPQAVTLASRLAALGEARRFAYEAAGDAFRPCDDWLAQADPPAPAGTPEPDNAPAPEAVAKKVDPAEVFRSQHTLNAVMTKQRGGMAIINGKLYAPGQTVDGFKLVKVDETEATLTCKGTTVTLRLVTAQATTATATAR
jgi:hypothetical protein